MMPYGPRRRQLAFAGRRSQRFADGTSAVPAAEGLGQLVEPLGAELGSTIRGTGVKGLSELGSSDVALFSTVQCNVALSGRIQPSRREKYWVSDPGTGVAHPPSGSASGGVRDGGTLHGLRW